MLALSESEDTLLFEQMPSRLNPAQGWIAHWDNKRAPDWDGGDGARWWAVDRTARIMALLGEDQSVSWGDMERVAYEIGRHLYIADFLKPYIITATNAIADSSMAASPRLSSRPGIRTL